MGMAQSPPSTVHKAYHWKREQAASCLCHSPLTVEIGNQLPGAAKKNEHPLIDRERKSSPVTWFARPSPAVNERRMSRIAKGLSDPLFKSKRSRTIAKGDGLGLAKPRHWCRPALGFAHWRIVYAKPRLH
jgi:hypothetical protein